MADQTAGLIKIPRIHVIDLTAANNGNAAGPLTIQADADFEWWFLSISRTSALLKLQIAEAGVGTRNMIFSGNPQANNFQGAFVDNIAGLVANNGALPIAVPYVMPAGRIYNHQVFDQGSGANNVFQAAYHGFALLRVS